MLYNNRYKLTEKLGEGGMGAVFAAIDVLRDDVVALKQVSVAANGLSFASQSADVEVTEALANEFEVLASLRHPHIISVLDYGFHKNGDDLQPFLTMELVQQPQTLTKAARTAKYPTRYRYLYETLLALSYLHEHGILHRDLKPANVLVGADGVKVLDFGLARRVHRPTAAEASLGGTLGYIAPELFGGATPSVQTDLYAFGLLALEVLTGDFPYDLTASPVHVIQQIMFETVDFEDYDLSPDVCAVLGQLIAKKPHERFNNARAVLEAFARASGEAPPPESAVMRDSILQSARFIGRETELTTLNNALNDMHTNKHGSAWLIGGESGVGKSRIANELRTQALIRGVLVLRGEAIDSGGGMFSLWQEVVQRLLLATVVEDFEARVLAAYVPDVARLLQRDVTPAPPLDDPAAERSRFSTIVVQLFERLQHPTLLLLEDLHWAELDTLKQLLGIVHTTPLMILGNYRNDEAPHLAEELTQMQHITLPRLDANETAALAISMVGEAANLPELLTLLQEETEGNAFFLIETVRALAEAAGSVSHIGRKSLPARVFAAGSISRIVGRRVERIPAEDQPLLQIAAILGREVNASVLAQVIDRYPQYAPPNGLQNWFLTCNNAAVLEPREQHWRFAHDRLREHILKNLPAQSEAYHHAALVLEALANTAQDDDPRLTLLADIWQQAGELDRELTYRVRIALHRTAHGQPSIARGHFQRAVEIHAALGRAMSFTFLNKMAGNENLVGEHTSGLAYAQRAFAIATTDRDRALGAIKIADAYTAAGDVEAGQKWADDALHYADRSHDLLIRKEIRTVRGYLHFRSSRYPAAMEEFQAAHALAQQTTDESSIMTTLSDISRCHYHLGNMDEAETLAPQLLDYFEKTGNYNELAMIYNHLGIIHGRRKNYEKSLGYYHACIEWHRRLGNEYKAAVVLMNMGVSTKNTGQYRRALNYYDQSEAIFRRYNLRFAYGVIEVNRALALLMLEDYQAAIDANVRGLRHAELMQAEGLIAHVAVGLARVAAAVGEYATAFTLITALLHSPSHEAHAIDEAQELVDSEILPHLDATTKTKIASEYADVSLEQLTALLYEGIPGYRIPPAEAVDAAST